MSICSLKDQRTLSSVTFFSTLIFRISTIFYRRFSQIDCTKNNVFSTFASYLTIHLCYFENNICICSQFVFLIKRLYTVFFVFPDSRLHQEDEPLKARTKNLQYPKVQFVQFGSICQYGLFVYSLRCAAANVKRLKQSFRKVVWKIFRSFYSCRNCECILNSLFWIRCALPSCENIAVSIINKSTRVSDFWQVHAIPIS